MICLSRFIFLNYSFYDLQAYRLVFVLTRNRLFRRFLFVCICGVVRYEEIIKLNDDFEKLKKKQKTQKNAWTGEWIRFEGKVTNTFSFSCAPSNCLWLTWTNFLLRESSRKQSVFEILEGTATMLFEIKYFLFVLDANTVVRSSRDSIKNWWNSKNIKIRGKKSLKWEKKCTKNCKI